MAASGAAPPGSAFWSFNEGSPGAFGSSGVYTDEFSTEYTFPMPDEEALPGVPKLHIYGTHVLSGATVDEPNYVSGSGANWEPGRSVQWEWGVGGMASTGNAFVFEFNSTGFSDFHLRFNYRLTDRDQFEGWNFTAIEYSLDNLSYHATGVATPALTHDSAFHEVAYDFSAVDAIENQSQVFLRFSMPNLPVFSSSFRFDNVELFSVPEPTGAALGLAAMGMLALRAGRRRQS